ncbi:MAG: type II toxin-antitoxin system ParD family antitoxin [Candidatus Obscuribacterales bacterium]|jgi:antitoxin ParD1/3/4|nr:type II toxin-antitoxin system ParD family antitoxin [Candidatus Obscuribacterales bacterium]
MNVSLTPELEKLINQKLESGMYTSASEVIRAGLRLLAEQDQLHQVKLDNLKSEIMVGVDQVKSGQTISSKNVFDKIRSKKR